MATSNPPPVQISRNCPSRLEATTIPRRTLDVSHNHSSLQSSHVHTPSISDPNTPFPSASGSMPEEKQTHYGNSNTFLRELAAHERQVLELKEELEKAEDELDNLKRQWASQEATKKRNEVQHVEQLQPFTTSLSRGLISRDAEMITAARDAERPRMSPSPTKPFQRTVFSGSRHARTLSLLSPKESLRASGSRPRDWEGMGYESVTARCSEETTSIPDLNTSTDGSSDSFMCRHDPPKDIFLETGKQLVGDFRQGLWTFFEDLRQVTVGDEAVRSSGSRTMAFDSPLDLYSKKGDCLSGRRNPVNEIQIPSGNASTKCENGTKLDSLHEHEHTE